MTVLQRFPKTHLALVLVSAGWLAVILTWWMLRAVIGEQAWWLHSALYLPATVWFIPPALLLPALLFFRSRLAWIAVLPLPIAFLLHPPEWHSPLPTQPAHPTLTLVTLNGGSREDLPPTAFLRETPPDFILLQDARDHLLWDSRIPGYEMHALDEFILFTRWPVLRKELIHYRPVFPSTVAARFEVSWQGKTFALYSIHLPSPRHVFREALGRIPGKSPWGILSAETREDYARRLANIQASETFVRLRLAREKLPLLIAGDFNLPPHSLFISRMEENGWADCFAERGRGWGASFPGDQPFWLAFNRPWLRLDYVFHSREWTALSCEVEPPSPAQHSAVRAVLELKAP